MLRTIGILLTFAVASTVQAGGYCRSCYAPAVQKVVYPQQIIQNQQVFYPLAPQLQYGPTPAIVEAQAQQIQRDIARLQDRLTEFNQYKVQAPQVVYMVPANVQQQVTTTTTTQAATTHTEGACGVNGNMAGGPAAPAFNQTASIIAEKCASCHSGDAPKGKLDLTGAMEIDCAEKMKALRKAITQQMPPPKSGIPPLTREETIQLDSELAKIPEPKPAALPPQQPEPPAPSPEPPAGENAAPSEFNGALERRGMKLVGNKIVVPQAQASGR